MFIKAYNEDKEGLAAELEEFDFLITTLNGLIVVVVIMFIKFFQRLLQMQLQLESQYQLLINYPLTFYQL
jgi:hypothetical protein